MCVSRSASGVSAGSLRYSSHIGMYCAQSDSVFISPLAVMYCVIRLYVAMSFSYAPRCVNRRALAPGSVEPVTGRYIYSTGFFVAEPQASFIVRLADWVSIDASVGYRFIGAANGLDNQLRGVTGGVTVRFGGGR